MDGIKYIIFGDKHFDMDDSCSIPCDTFDDGEYKAYGKICWEITALLWLIFSKNKRNFLIMKKYIEFYLEYPFVHKDQLIDPTLRQSNINEYKNLENSHIGRISELYYNCFVKKPCPFDGVRFHYTDIRQKFLSPNMDRSKDNLISRFIDNKIFGFIHMLASTIERNHNQHSNYEYEHVQLMESDLEILNLLIKNFYSNTKNPKFLAYFMLCLTSDDFITDVNNLFNDMFHSIEDINKNIYGEIMEKIIPVTTLSIRNGKTVHKIRAQFIVLEQEGKKDLVNSIINFYISKINVLAICKFYTNVMDIINNIYHNNIVSDSTDSYLKIEYHDEYYSDNSQEDETEGEEGTYTQDQYILSFIIEDIDNEYMKQILYCELFLYDIYTLARMFKNYVGSPSGQKIVYCGNTHAYYMSLFLSQEVGFPMESYGFVGVHTPENVSRCINVDINNFI